MSINTIGIIGGGAWGTALAQTITQANKDVSLWCFEKDVADDINQHRINSRYLPDIPLSDKIHASHVMDDVLKTSEAVLIVTPAQHTDTLIKDHLSSFRPSVPLLICAKGIEIATGRLLSQILQGYFPETPIGALSGPSFASEVAKGLPTAITLAIEKNHEEIGYALCDAIAHPGFRPYLSDDILGVQIGGALKNVIAIACGIAEGRQMGHNTRAALITRGLAEMTRFGQAFGADPTTFAGLSGLGDLTLTCNAMESRNFSFGVEIGRGQSVADILANRQTVTEGAYTAKAVHQLAQKHNIDMPITQAVFEALESQKALDHVIKGLLARPIKAE